MVRYCIGPCGFAQESAAVPVSVVTHTVPVFLFYVIHDVGGVVMVNVYVLLRHNDRTCSAASEHVSHYCESGPFHYSSKGDHQ